MSRTVDFDVVIVGAGPAGTAAAIWSRRAGLRVAILERSTAPRFKVGEALHPGVEVILVQLGVAERVSKHTLVRYDGIWIERGRSRRFVPFGSDSRGRWLGLQVDRARFDQALCDRAIELGAVVLQPCRVHAVMRDGPCMLLNCEQGPLRSRVVVDGTGSRRMIATQLGSESILCSPRIVARYGYRAGAAPRLPDRPVFTVKRSGWQWIARVRPGVYQWINAYRGADPPNADEIPHQLRELRETAPTRGADVSWRILQEPSSQGFFAVGDAAAVLDPSSSHGVLRALSTGIMAAHCIQAQLRGNAKESTVTRFYNGWVRRWFTADCHRLRDVYRYSA
jgi:flavin-dependent dehydrogenase